MEIDIQHRPGASVAVCRMAPGEAIRAESDAMVSMAGHFDTKTDSQRKRGGLLKNLGRAALGGESFFTNLFTAQSPGELCLAASLPGDMVVHTLAAGEELFINGGGFVAAPESVMIDTKFQGLVKGFLSGASMFLLKATGSGPVIMNGFGGISSREVDGELWIDTGHLVAFTSGLTYELGKASSGWLAAMLSAEGIIIKMRGRGRVYLQTRNPTAFGRSVGPMLPSR